MSRSIRIRLRFPLTPQDDRWRFLASSSCKVCRISVLGSVSDSAGSWQSCQLVWGKAWTRRHDIRFNIGFVSKCGFPLLKISLFSTAFNHQECSNNHIWPIRCLETDSVHPFFRAGVELSYSAPISYFQTKLLFLFMKSFFEHMFKVYKIV